MTQCKVRQLLLLILVHAKHLKFDGGQNLQVPIIIDDSQIFKIELPHVYGGFECVVASIGHSESNEFNNCLGGSQKRVGPRVYHNAVV